MVNKPTGGKCKKTKISPINTADDTSPLASQSIDGFPLPNFSSFQKKQLSPDSKIMIPKMNESFDIETDVKPNDAGKIPIPRLQNMKLKPMASPSKNILQPPRSKSRNQQKYKAIQPKPYKCDTVVAQEGSTQVDSNDVISSIDEEQLKDIDYLTRERLISVSNVDKDALDDYLHGDNNSQEQEEELLQYFNNAPKNEVKEDERSNGSKSDKLSQLRLLLEQNLNPMLPDVHQKGVLMKDEKHFLSRMQMPSVKRRVSFETSGLEETVPPSPNTRRKNFSFTPISPGPHSPSGLHSKPSSTNASPFVSPRNTPVPRAKTACHTITSFASQQKIIPSKKHTKRVNVLKTDTEMYMEPEPLPQGKQFITPLNILPKCNLPMSAPPSPMLTCKQKVTQPSNLLQKLLDSNSKVPYVPDYEKNDIPNQDVQQILTTSTFRSQSVPLHQMASFKTLMSPCVPTTPQTQFNFNFDNNAIPAPTPVQEFSDFESFADTDMLNNGLNNENINQILDILDTTQNNEENVQTENVFTFPNANITPFNELQPGIIQHSGMENPKPARSQSIEEHIVDLDLQNMRQQKFGQISRSVPSTPLPFKKLEINLNNNQIRDVFDCEKTLNAEQDYLLNGQPVKKKFIVANEMENASFPPSMGFIMNENGNFERNLNPLLEQDFNEPDDFTTVPNMSGS